MVRRGLLALAVCFSAVTSTPVHANPDDATIMVMIGACDQGDADACTGAADELKRRRLTKRIGHTATTLRAKAAELHAAKCAAKDGDACFAQGLALVSQKDGRADAKIAEACSLGSGEACLYIGVRTKQPAKALALFERACTANNAHACELVAQKIARKERARSVELHAKACLGEDLAGCLSTGAARRAGNDLPAALAAFASACEIQLRRRYKGSDAGACHIAGTIARTAGHSASNGTRARELFEKACAVEHAQACIHLGEMRARGEGGARHWRAGLAEVSTGCKIARDKACKPLVALRKSPPDATCTKLDDCSRLCDEALWPACRRVAELDPSLLDAEMLEDACTAGDVPGCVMRGDLEGTYAAAVPWYERACMGKDTQACLYARVARPTTANVAALAKACMNDANACPLYALAVGKRDLKKAQKALQKACDAKVGSACRYLAQTFSQTSATGGGWNEIIVGDSRYGGGTCDCDLWTWEPRSQASVDDANARASMSDELLRRGCQAGDTRSCEREDGPVGKALRVPAWQ